MMITFLKLMLELLEVYLYRREKIFFLFFQIQLHIIFLVVDVCVPINVELLLLLMMLELLSSILV